AFDQACGLAPRFEPGRVAASNAWLRAGRTDLAVERAELALRISGTPEARISGTPEARISGTPEARISGTTEAWSALALAEFRSQITRPTEERFWIRFEQSLTVLEQIGEKAFGTSPWQVDFLHADYVMVRANSRNDTSGATREALRILQQCEQK